MRNTSETIGSASGNQETSFHEMNITCRTKLKLDKEVGGGDLSELCTITYLIAYPYA